MEQWPTALLHPEAFPHPVKTLRLIETGISWVILTGEFAYKIKKPLRTDFIDALTVERRKFLCEEEVRLNRRFCQDLYLGVVSIARDARGVGIDRMGSVVEHAVMMRQFDQSQEMAHALAHGGVTADEMARLGTELARLHRHASASPLAAEYGSPSLIELQILANFAPLQEALRGDTAMLKHLAVLEKWTQQAMTQARFWMIQRRSCLVRDCHGDLHAGNVVFWQGRWQPIDCLEFNPALRWIDVISDLAFLFMDLRARARPELAAALLNAYLEESGDYEGLRLLPLYAVYRALVRARVAALSQQSAVLRNYLRTAQVLTRTQHPFLILMHGVSASGKSWASARLARQLGALRIRSDVERHRIGGPAADAAGTMSVGERYTPDGLRTSYRRLQFCADSALSAGYPVIVDASFLDRERRGEFQALADRRGCSLLIVSCEAPLAVLEQRLRERQARGADPSEATWEVLRGQWDALRAFDVCERGHVITIDTSESAAAEDTLRELCEQARLRLRLSAEAAS